MIRKIPLGAGNAPYSQALRVGGGQDLIFVSGQLARADAGRAHHPGDLGRQAREIFANIDALLKEAGGSLANVVKITAFVTTLEGYDDYSRIRSEVFSDPRPASATVQVTSLVTPGCLIEIEAIAII